VRIRYVTKNGPMMKSSNTFFQLVASLPRPSRAARRNPLAEGELTERLEVGEPDADKSKRSRPVAERAVEQAAR
jgi:hypothetical protein